jgi:hypothetical protein
MRRRAIAFVLAAACIHGRAAGQSLELSSDTTLSLRGVVVGPAAPAADAGTAVTLGGLGPPGHAVTLPPGVNLDGFERTSTGDVYFSTDVSTAIAGLAAPGVAGPGDVVKVTASGPTRVFSAESAGLPPGTNVDAVGVESNGDLLLSFDTTVKLGSLTIAPEDVVRVNPSTFAVAIVYDGSAQGIAPGLNLDAVSRRTDTSHLSLSFDGAGSAGGVAFSARDVLDWNPTTGAYALVYKGSAAGWPDGANLDEVSGIPTDADGDSFPWSVDDCPYIANPSQSDVGGVKPGSPPDGIGDACQCGEVNNDGRVLASDVTSIRAGLTGSTSAVLAPERCNVIGPVNATPLATGMRSDCNEADVVVIRRALSSLGPGIAQVCKPALP